MLKRFVGGNEVLTGMTRVENRELWITAWVKAPFFAGVYRRRWEGVACMTACESFSRSCTECARISYIRRL